MKQWLGHYLPAVNWIPRYQPQYLVGDIISGIIVTSLLIPQSMAYALLAGLPPQVGLYTSILPAIIYPLLGTSSVLAVGPVAVDSLMVATAISQFAAESTPEYITLALTLAFLVGSIELLIGGLRLGFLVNFISRAVISGFISGAAVIIAFSQIKNLLGLQIPSTESFFELLILLIRNLPETNLITLALGLVSMGILFYFNNPLVKQLKHLGWSDQMIVPVSKSAPLLVVILGTLLVWGLRLDERVNLQIVGEIPAGLPSLTIPNLDLETVELLLPAAIAIALVGYLEGFAGGQALASKRREKLDPNQELIALGVANWGVAFSGGYPVTGGLARSVVNFTAGANTGVASIITGLLIAVTVMFLTSLFYFLPMTVLAAIIMMAVYRLIEVGKLRRMWLYDKADAIAWLATFIIVLGLGVEQGILFGTLIALGFHLWRTSHPHIAIVGRLGDSEHFRNVLRHPVKTHPEVLAVRVDESLYFANAKYLENFINGAIADQVEVKKVLLVCNAVNLIDASGLEILEGLVADLNSLGIKLYLSEVKGPVMDKLTKIGFIDYIGRDHVFLTTDQAMQTLANR
ncbi:MAG: SulP family inorganic anion transporter [Halothece sp.]